MAGSRSTSLLHRANQVIPGGVNSPVRAFNAVDGSPPFINRAEGCELIDEDEVRYIDLIASWGPMIHGHSQPAIRKALEEQLLRGTSFGAPTYKEILLAECIVKSVPSIESVRLVSSGTEACMSAIRLARGFTNRHKIIKIDGCYHGHADALLVKAGSGAETFGVPDSAGVTPGCAQDTLTIPFNDLKAATAVVDKHASEIASIILEPIPGNMGCVLPDEGYLQGLRELCTANKIILIFDEVMSGFRVARGGAQELYNITPDLSCLGKIIGGGLPVGAYGGKKEIMEHVSPLGPVYQAGTLSGNPLAVTAGIESLKLLTNDLYQRLEDRGRILQESIRYQLTKKEIPHCINRVGSMMTLFFATGPIRNMDGARTSDLKTFKSFHHHMIQQHIYWPPSQFEALFLSDAITMKHIDRIIEAVATWH